jgi:hypothetical protein
MPARARSICDGFDSKSPEEIIVLKLCLCAGQVCLPGTARAFNFNQWLADITERKILSDGDDMMQDR